jgi:hypothetical protein
MDLKEFRDKYADELTKPASVIEIIPDVCALGVRITRIKARTDVTEISKYTVKGFTICHSRMTGRWWIEDSKGHHHGWATDFQDAKKIIDIVIERLKGD